MSRMLPIDSLVLLAKLDQAFRRDIRVISDAVLFLDFTESSFEMLVLDFHHNIAKHVDQTTVSIVSKSWVICSLS